MFKRFIRCILIATMLLTLAPTVFAYAGTFGDVKADDWHAEAIGWLSSKGIVNGYEDGNFGPQQQRKLI